MNIKTINDLEKVIKSKKIFENLFEVEEIEICRDSKFYKYINFENIIY